VAEAHEMAKLVHVGRHYAAVAFLEKGSPVTSISKAAQVVLPPSPNMDPLGMQNMTKS
jgi:hypothetical protein